MNRRNFLNLAAVMAFAIVLFEVSFCHAADSGGSKVYPGADERTPAYSQYFSWINNTNEGSTEKQTMVNLDFFKWLHDEYGMVLDIYVVSAGAIALGTLLGGWRLIRTLGGKIYKVRPIHGFTSQVSGAGVILGASILGGPVSTTQVMSSAIVGAGAGERVNKVRWNVLRSMVYAWLLTIPITVVIARILYLILNQFSL